MTTDVSVGECRARLRSYRAGTPFFAPFSASARPVVTDVSPDGFTAVRPGWPSNPCRLMARVALAERPAGGTRLVVRFGPSRWVILIVLVGLPAFAAFSSPSSAPWALPMMVVGVAALLALLVALAWGDQGALTRFLVEVFAAREAAPGDRP